MSWVVGRGDPTVYVEEASAKAGEAEFETEEEALAWAIDVETDWIEAFQRSRRELKARLRKLRRRA